MKLLTKQEIHQLAMQETGSFLESEGYEFLAVNSNINQSPQFICIKEKLLHFVIVKGCLYPKSPHEYDVKRINKVKIHAEKNNAKLYFAGVGFANAENFNLPLLKNNPYVVNFSGLKKIL